MLTELVEMPHHVRREQGQRGKTGRHHGGVPRERPGVVDRPHVGWIKTRHDISAPTESADWKTATNDLAEGREVRRHAETLLRATGTKTKRYDFVEDQEHAKLTRQIAESAQKLRVGRDHTAHRYRLHDHGGQPGSMRAKSTLYGV